MADNGWTESFDSPLLFILNLGAALTFAGSLIFAQLSGANTEWFLALMVFIVMGMFVYDKIGGTDFGERPDFGQLGLGVAVGLGVTTVISLVASFLIGHLTASIWVPSGLVQFTVQAGSNSATAQPGQVLLDIPILMFFVGPGEQALVGLGAGISAALAVDEDTPLIQQPFVHGAMILVAILHVAFGQYPWWFFFVAYPTFITFTWAADIAGDWAASSLTHSLTDVLSRTIQFFHTGL